MRHKGFRQFIKFGIVGVINTILDWGIFFVLTHFIVTVKEFEPTAKAISFLITIISAFILHSRWTFKGQLQTVSGENITRNSQIFTKFFVVSIIGWGINYFIFKYTRLQLNQSQIVSLVVASGFGIIWNFFVNKFWTFRS